MGFILLLAFAHFSHHVLTALLVPLLPFIRNEFALSYAQSGFIVSAFTIAYGIAQIPAGWVADKVGPRYLLLVGISGVALAGTVVGLSTSYLLLILALFLVGIAGGAYHPSASSLISGTVPAKSRGPALGFHIIGGSASHFLAPLIAAGLVAALSWRGTFLTLAAPVFLLGVVVFVFQERRLRTEQATAGTTAGAPDGVDGPSGEAAQTADPSPRDEEAEAPQSIPRIVVYLVLTGLFSAVIASVIAYVPLFLVDTHQVDERLSAAFLSIVFAAGFYAAPLGGFISDRLGRIPVMVSLPIVLAPLFMLMPIVPFGLPFGALLLAVGTLMFARMPTSEAFLAASVPKRLRGTVLGIYFFSGMEGSALLTPLLGSMIDRWGFSRSFTVTGAILLVAGVLAAAFFFVTRRSGGAASADPREETA
jgi:FSR family fosmidomycin resistance protein-like MFS transporter